MVSPSIPLRIVAGPRKEGARPQVYRPFFLAGILSVLTAGCLLGALALVGICLQGSYVTSTWTPYVLAHANSQLYGWVGFFVMGFTLQQHQPRASREKLYWRLAWLSLIAMAIGIGMRFAAEPMASAGMPLGIPLGVASCVFQIVAVMSFLVNVSTTRDDLGGLTWQTLYIFTSLFYLAAVSVAEPFYFAASHGSQFESIQAIAHWATILRDAQFLGFVANMIFGVSLIRLSRCFGFPNASKTLGSIAFVLWNGGLLLRLIGWNTYFASFLAPEQMSAYTRPAFALALAGILLAWSSGVFERPVQHVRAHKFMRASYVWLIIAGIMLAAEPMHLHAIGAPFSHAYIGAVRHAVTVGFISQMILGFGLHIVSKMNSILDQTANKLWLAFILINVGNAGRVGFQLATDYWPGAFSLMGPTGFIELTGLILWAAEIIRILRPFKKVSYAS